MSSTYLFTSESVSEGHPDKVADQISDAVLDELLRQDPCSRVACETLITTGLIVIAGEITSKGTVDYANIARGVVRDIGYNDGAAGMDYKSCGIITTIDKQSPDIAQGVDHSDNKEQGAGDQGMMFGYACDETDSYMPATIHYSHQLLRHLAASRHANKVKWLRPDSKSQVTMSYTDGVLKHIDTIVLSTQHAEDVTHAQVKDFVIEECIKKVIPSELLQNTKYHINPTGRFVIGGPHGDCGLTGRKIIVDTYGGHGAHGGGAFSGKDPSKVDRSAAYMARYVAKNIVAAGLAKRCMVQLAYAIGIAEPVGVFVETYGTSKHPSQVLADVVKRNFGLKPREIIDHLDLLRPIYKPTASYGHFGRSEFPWERTDKVAALRA